MGRRRRLSGLVQALGAALSPLPASPRAALAAAAATSRGCYGGDRASSRAGCGRGGILPTSLPTDGLAAWATVTATATDRL